MTNRHGVRTSKDLGLVGESYEILPEREGVGALLKLLSNVDDDWMRDGWCWNESMLQAWGLEPDAWMEPDPATGTFDPAARELCLACPVRDRCHEWAVANREEWGLWGGRGPGARRRIWGAGSDQCRNGHEYTPENTYVNPRTGRYRCRTCENARQRVLREGLRDAG